MATVTGGFAFKPLFTSSKAAMSRRRRPQWRLFLSPSPRLICRSSLKSASPTASLAKCSLVLAPHGLSVAACYDGSVSRYSGPGDWTRSRQSDSDDDQELDVFYHQVNYGTLD